MDTAAQSISDTPKKQKRPTKDQQIAHLTLMLNLRCSELETLQHRERHIYNVLGGKFGGESPIDCAQRAATERSTLADKVLAKDALLKNAEHRLELSNREVGRLQGQIDAILAIAEAAAS